MMPAGATVLGVPGDLVAAPLIGLGFGWCLERAGLGSAPKLAGQFYLADLTVFKVMFSALVTAMLAVFWLDRTGLLDLNRVYLPETFVAPQALGGVVFGLGFIVAGLCPGTSCVAAATGRRDGLATAIGIVAGVLIFNAAYDAIAPFYESTSLGAVTLPDLMGISLGTGVAFVTVAALVAFAFVHVIEGRPLVTPRHRIAAVVVFAAGIAAAAAPAGSAGDAARIAADIEAERDHLSAPVLAERLMRGDKDLRVIDLRSAQEFTEQHIPTAEALSIEQLSKAALPRDADLVLYSEGGTHAAQAWVLMRLRGYRRVFVLREGLYEWLARVREPRLAVDATEAERAEFARAAVMSRFFGGVPRSDVPRADVPVGYWTGESAAAASVDPARELMARVRRRGC